ncbi:MAG: PKD domain-containing protein [Patescibacteria group bacterium]|nr:PKD domain-containing protein [Patescibacteria group bacterium]
MIKALTIALIAVGAVFLVLASVLTFAPGAIGFYSLTASATITASPSSGNAPLTVTFTGTPVGQLYAPLTCVFYPGDGSPSLTSTNCSPFSFTYTYASCGTFTVNFYEIGSDGNEGKGSTTVQVCSTTTSISTSSSSSVSSSSTSQTVSSSASTSSTSTMPLTVVIYSLPSSNPLSVAYNVTTIGGISGTITCAWNFGDGTTGTGCPVSHTYSSGGTFDVSVTVTSSSGQSAQATQTFSLTSTSSSTATTTSTYTTSTSGCTSNCNVVGYLNYLSAIFGIGLMVAGIAYQKFS